MARRPKVPIDARLGRQNKQVDQRFYRRKDEPRASAGAGNASGAHAPRQWVHVLHVQHGAASLEERPAVRGIQAWARACAWVQQELADDTDVLAEPCERAEQAVGGSVDLDGLTVLR